MTRELRLSQLDQTIEEETIDTVLINEGNELRQDLTADA